MMTDERRKKVARELFDRLIQELAQKMLPILETDSRFKVEINGSREREKPLGFSVTEYIN